MLGVSSPHMTHHSASQADLDVLALLTGEHTNSLGPLSSARSANGSSGGAAAGVGGVGAGVVGQDVRMKKRQVSRRDGPMESLMLSAVIAGADKVSRHHFGHGAARPYASCDESRPSSPGPARDMNLASRAAMRSMQAPRSERLRKEREAQGQAQARVQGGSGLHKAGESSTSPLSGASAASSDRPSHPSPHSSHGHVHNGRPHRRLSIDPAPISATLQTVSSPPFSRPVVPNPSTLFVPRSSPTGPRTAAATITTATPSKPLNTRPQVRCMARTRIPTPHGSLFLHLYHNSADAKEHLAIVLDPIQLDAEARRAAPRGRKEIRSRTLDECWREGETAMERVVRGAYTGRLGPGGEDQASRPTKIGAGASADGTTHDSASAVEEEPVEREETDGSKMEDDILPMVRIHSECFTGETIGSMRCDCGEQLDEAIRQIASPHRLSPSTNGNSSTSSTGKGKRKGKMVPGRGVVIYMRQEGRGIGLLEKLRAYNLQDLGHDTVAANLMLGHGADERKYDVAAEILRDLGLAGDGDEEGESKRRTGIRLLTNNPEKVQGLAKEGVYVQERVGMVPRHWKCSGQDDEPRNLSESGELSDSRVMSEGEGEGGAMNVDVDVNDEEVEYQEWRARRAGVGLIGAGKAHGGELEKYLRTKVERMGHMIDLPESRNKTGES